MWKVRLEGKILIPILRGFGFRMTPLLVSGMTVYPVEPNHPLDSKDRGKTEKLPALGKNF